MRVGVSGCCFAVIGFRLAGACQEPGSRFARHAVRECGSGGCVQVCVCVAVAKMQQGGPGVKKGRVVCATEVGICAVSGSWR